MPSVRLSELRAGIASGRITDDDVAKMHAAGVGVIDDESTAKVPTHNLGSVAEPSAEDQFREDHPVLAQLDEVGKGLRDAPITTAVGAGKSAMEVGYHIARAFGMKKNEDYEKLIEKNGVGENVGGFVADALPFVAGEGPIASVSKAAGKIAPAVPRLVEGAAKYAARFGLGDLVARAEGSEHPEVAGAANATLPILFDAIGSGAMKLGRKFQISQIRPTKADAAAGFAIDNVNKYDVSGNTLPETLSNVHNEIVSRANQIRDIMQSANDAAPEGAPAEGLAAEPHNPNTQPYASDLRDHKSAVEEAIKAGKKVPDEVIAQYPDLANAARNASISGPKVDLTQAIDEVEKKMLSRAKQLENPADEVERVRGAIATYRKWAEGLPDGGSSLTLDEGQTAKRAIGLKGAWSYGKSDADSGLEKVSNELYSVVKSRLEKATDEVAAQAGEKGGEVRRLNKELGELMPIEQAIIRRLPVAARNNPLSLTDLMLFATGHPVAGISHVLSRTMAGATATFKTGQFASRAAAPIGNVAAAGAGAMGSARRRLREAQ